MDKDFYIACHEELIEKYMEANPTATEQEAYDATADAVYDYALDKFADMADWQRDYERDNMMGV